MENQGTFTLHGVGHAWESACPSIGKMELGQDGYLVLPERG